MSNYKITKAVLHNTLFIQNVKDFGKTLVAGTFVASTQANLELSLEGDFLKAKVGNNLELIPLSNVAHITVKE